MNSWHHCWTLVEVFLGIGAEPKTLTFVQISARGIIVVAAALVMIRLGHRRSLAQKTVFDTVLIVILASVLARPINGSAPLFETLGCGFVLVFLFRFFAWIAYRSHAFGKLIKGTPGIVVENGNMNSRVMARNQISKHDLEEDMRLNAHTEDLASIRVARIDRSGDTSFIKVEK